MIAFIYDKTFDGLLSVVFDAYLLRQFPDILLQEGVVVPMQYTVIHKTVSDPAKVARVFAGLKKCLAPESLKSIFYVWLSEESGSGFLLFQYIRAMLDAELVNRAGREPARKAKALLENDTTMKAAGTALQPRPIGIKEMEVPLRADKNFCNTVILEVEKLADRVGREHMHWLGFVRFQQTRDDVYFSAISPKYNILPLLLEHFIDRFSDQKWVIYDVRRGYGYYFDLEKVQDMHLDPAFLRGAELDTALLAEGEKRFQLFWEQYCGSISIKERANPRLQQHFMPKRFWPYLTEKQKNVRAFKQSGTMRE